MADVTTVCVPVDTEIFPLVISHCYLIFILSTHTNESTYVKRLPYFCFHTDNIMSINEVNLKKLKL